MCFSISNSCCSNLGELKCCENFFCSISLTLEIPLGSQTLSTSCGNFSLHPQACWDLHSAAKLTRAQLLPQWHANAQRGHASLEPSGHSLEPQNWHLLFLNWATVSHAVNIYLKLNTTEKETRKSLWAHSYLWFYKMAKPGVKYLTVTCAIVWRIWLY